MRIRGTGGALRVGCQTAATLGEWTLTRTRVTPEPTYAAEATVVQVDTFWSQQRPIELELSIGNRRWAWTNIHPDIGEQSLAVTLIGGPAIH